jgi:hypothetical protein
MRVLALALVLLASPAHALDLRSFTCFVTDFVDDSRYPLDAAAVARYRSMVLTITDAGDRVVVETLLPGPEVESRQLSVIERTPSALTAEARGENSLASLRLDGLDSLGTPDTGSFIFRTYETDHIWSFTCGD